MGKPTQKSPFEDLLHDLHNVLNSISMQSEVAELYMIQGDVESALEAMKAIQAECKRFSLITHKLSDK